jgi:hypothetical protein
VVVPGIIENEIGPIRSPVTGDEHRARVVLPGGFEFTEAEMADAHTYGQLHAFDWSNAHR